ncbi:hypothetical protein CEXT_700721 [Caerostris extrusa]|uniref:Uncharacterized protein n=1 Tax=Caerostris extrusa TaxID=172846 RepID=A0AAV4PV99_CAEEX|nr:hypothetical protein CEXT_700721 [Caerostris extrusa]
MDKCTLNPPVHRNKKGFRTFSLAFITGNVTVFSHYFESDGADFTQRNASPNTNESNTYSEYNNSKSALTFLELKALFGVFNL